MSALTLPLLAFLRFRGPWLPLAAILGGGWWLFWILTAQTQRFCLPALAILVLVASIVAVRSVGRVRLVWVGVMAYLALVHMAYAGFMSLRTGGYREALGAVSRADYLAQAQPTYPSPYYRAAQYINEKTEPDSRVLMVGETRGFYLERRFLASTAVSPAPLARRANESSSPEALAQRLREAGFTHVLVNGVESYRLRNRKLFVVTRRGAENLVRVWASTMDSVYSEGGPRPQVFRIRPEPLSPSPALKPLPFYLELKDASVKTKRSPPS